MAVSTTRVHILTNEPVTPFIIYSEDRSIVLLLPLLPFNNYVHIVKDHIVNDNSELILGSYYCTHH